MRNYRMDEIYPKESNLFDRVCWLFMNFIKLLNVNFSMVCQRVRGDIQKKIIFKPPTIFRNF